MRKRMPELCIFFWIVLTSMAPALDMMAIIPSELHQELMNQRGVLNDAEARNHMRQASIESKRLDLIATCFAYPGTKYQTLDAVKKLPASDSKVKMVIAMLRAPSSFWPLDREEGGFLGRSMLDPAYVLVEPFSSTVNELLPGKAFTVESVRYQGRRNKLANELLDAFQKRGGQITEEELQALLSMPLALNSAAEGGMEDPAYTRIPPAEKERYMKAAFKDPEWVPPVVKPKEPLLPPPHQPSKPQKIESPSSTPPSADFSVIWIGGSVVAAAILGWLVKLIKP